MRIGMSPTSSYPRDSSSKVLFDNLQAQVELMAELGFASLSLGDHHITRDNYLQVHAAHPAVSPALLPSHSAG